MWHVKGATKMFEKKPPYNLKNLVCKKLQPLLLPLQQHKIFAPPPPLFWVLEFFLLGLSIKLSPSS